MFYRAWLWLLQVLGFDPRKTFRWYDGKQFRTEDPMVLLGRKWDATVDMSEIQGHIDELPFETEKVGALIASGVGTKILRGYSLMGDAAAQIFHVLPYSEGGLTNEECERLIQRFDRYIGDLKKNANDFPTLSQSMASRDESPTSNSSDSTSTSTDNTIVMPDVSGLELQSALSPPPPSVSTATKPNSVDS